MALTGRVLFSHYENNGPTNGRAISLPSALTAFSDLSTARTIAGATINAIVELLPTGLVQAKRTYYTPSTAAQLQSAGN